MTLEEILQDIHGLDARLRELESEYGVLSEDVHALYRLGELEQSRDLIRWMGYYDLRQDRLRALDFTTTHTQSKGARPWPCPNKSNT